MQVDRCANQLSRTNFSASVLYGGKDRFRLYPEERRFEIWQPRRFCQFDWRVGAYPSEHLAHASARRMGTDRSGAWGVGCGFWGRLQRERRVCWSVAVFKFLFSGVYAHRRSDFCLPPSGREGDRLRWKEPGVQFR